MGFISHWDYLPDWVPVPAPNQGYVSLVPCFLPFILCIFGIPTLLAAVIALLVNYALFVRRALSGHISAAVKIGIALTALSSAVLVLLLGGPIHDALLKYAIVRYNVAIDAIEEYHADQEQYPPELNALVPDYLARTPGLYMKFGEVLIYEPGPSSWYDHAPFTFELYGHYTGIHGQTLKYCPIEIDPCFEGGGHLTPMRIDDRWIWVYSSAL
ncbi:MAG: hypothetical protein CEE40_07325 [Chloroflexi bacterium B3_Chlor]|nr:MAG: hypothetical protein CEE40_07325 [Chloroflexi bacterium B3_Chlor]